MTCAYVRSWTPSWPIPFVYCFPYIGNSVTIKSTSCSNWERHVAVVGIIGIRPSLSTSPLILLFILIFGWWSTRQLPVLKFTKKKQLQQDEKLPSGRDVLPPAKFDFSFAGPAVGNIYEPLKATHSCVGATYSPVSSSLLYIFKQFEQLAAHTTLFKP